MTCARLQPPGSAEPVTSLSHPLALWLQTVLTGLSAAFPRLIIVDDAGSPPA